MAVRPILLPWARQPNNEFALDRQWRPSFVFVPIGGTFADAVSQLPGLIDSGGANGTPTYTATGRALNFAHLSSRSQYLVLPNFAPGTGDFWVLVHGSYTVHSAVGVVFSNDSGQSAGTRQWRLQSGYNGSSLSNGAFSFLTYGGAFVGAGANSLVTAGELTTFLGVRRGTAVELWKDGRLVGSSTGTAQDVSGAEAQRVGWGWDTGGGYTAGSICDLAAGGLGTLSPSHAAKLSANPWQLFEPRRIWVPVASAGGGGGITQAVTGSAATSVVGTLAPSISLALTGNAATAAVGSVAPGFTAELTGAAATTAVGTPVAGIELSLSGVAATSAVGTVSSDGSISQALTGNAAASAQGLVGIDLSVPLTGNAAAAAVGSVAIGGDLTVALTGNAATAYAGTLQLDAPLTNAQMQQLYAWVQQLVDSRLLTLPQFIALK